MRWLWNLAMARGSDLLVPVGTLLLLKGIGSVAVAAAGMLTASVLSTLPSAIRQACWLRALLVCREEPQKAQPQPPP